MDCPVGALCLSINGPSSYIYCIFYRTRLDKEYLLALRTSFEGYLRTRWVSNTERGAYVKWLRYYLDFCSKYHFPEDQRGSLAHFLHKLEEKR